MSVSLEAGKGSRESGNGRSTHKMEPRAQTEQTRPTEEPEASGQRAGSSRVSGSGGQCMRRSRGMWTDKYLLALALGGQTRGRDGRKTLVGEGTSDSFPT